MPNKRFKSVPLYQVDAFADEVFCGNPAAVCPVQGTLPERLMLSIASENNLSETAFVDLSVTPYEVRWFTPVAEVDLCGHATLAAARILFDEFLGPEVHEVDLDSKSGRLRVLKKGPLMVLDFPKDEPSEREANPLIEEILGVCPKTIFRGRDDFLVIFNSQEEVEALAPDFSKLSCLPSRGLIASAPGEDADFVSRSFFPHTGEDPVTGSAHTLMIPYWARVLNKKQLKAYQCSARGGRLSCELVGERVYIGGSTVRYLDGTIFL